MAGVHEIGMTPMTAGNNLYSIILHFVIKGTQISMKMQKCVTFLEGFY